ncbi:MAG: hypothetical protein OJF52_004412 [Nitrospira sp.]|jgi:hypothetical protein|nr:hypothetical protein [Nitrospira sp.]WHZ17560.1 MAG: hypothetical protein OJF52_004412 [Nitrospira sp.]
MSTARTIGRAKKGAHRVHRQTNIRNVQRDDAEKAAHDRVIQRYSGVGKPDAFKHC